MQAAEKNLLEILSRMSRQYRVPLFQRRYVWDEEQWGELWDDLVALVPEGDGLPSTRHFVGSIVTQQGDGALKNVVPFMIIDGQQRLTTFLLLLKAMDDHAATIGADVRDLLRGYLRNPSTKEDNIFQILPTKINQNTFQTIMASSSPADLESKNPAFARPKGRARDRRSALVRAYVFFYSKLDVHRRIDRGISGQRTLTSPRRHTLACAWTARQGGFDRVTCAQKSLS